MILKINIKINHNISLKPISIKPFHFILLFLLMPPNARIECSKINSSKEIRLTPAFSAEAQ
jgi:hypothetical protein